jgi:hypothetical protein
MKYVLVIYCNLFLERLAIECLLGSMTTKVLRATLINHIFIIHFIFSLPVSIEFAVSIHCNGHRIILVCMCFPSVVFFPSPYLFVVVIIMLSLYIFHPLCFPFAVFVQCGHYSDISCFIFQFPLNSSYSFIVVVIVSSLYIFHPLCFTLCRVCLSWSASYHPYMFSIICVFRSLCLSIDVIIQIW